MILKLLVLSGAVFALGQATYYKPKTIVKTSTCPYGWIDFNGYCYFFSTKRRTRRTAADICKDYNAALVQISSKKENNYLKEVAASRKVSPKDSYWIAPICKSKNNKYPKYSKYCKCKWRGLNRFTDWYGKPKGPGCAVLYYSYNCQWKYWKVDNCNNKNYFICKRPAILKVVRPWIKIFPKLPGYKRVNKKANKRGRKYYKSNKKRGKKYYGKRGGKKYYGKRGGKKYYGKRGGKKYYGKRGKKYYGKRGKKYYGKRGKKYYGKRGKKYYRKRGGKKYYGKRGKKYYGKRGKKYYGKRGGKKYYGKRGKKYYGKRRGKKYYGKRGGKKRGSSGGYKG